ncbi:hypothetical protein F2Q68_00017544 [Brassica cretica]|uniref:Mucin-2-like n=1 Tax=Brassica cretica TaxID=69181 RepID=A0A8S9HAW1_BRACR|nr:hypothetical protein F2Q68_00017544 [Brassica cretica]
MTGFPFLPLPPDPPDLTQYSPLSPSVSSLVSSKSKLPFQPILPTVVHVLQVTNMSISDTEMVLEDNTAVVFNTTSALTGPAKTGSANTVAATVSTETFTILNPKSSSPLHTNRASSPTQTSSHPISYTIPSISTPSNPINLQTKTSPILPAPKLPSPVLANPLPSSQTTPQPTPVINHQTAQNPNPNPNPNPTLVEKIRRSENKTLRRLAPLQFSETGRPRVLIPDEVFQKGADLHKDFIVCYFK